MKVPYQLRRRDTSEPAAALLVPGHEPAELLRLLAALGLDPLPPIHALADGFLVKLPEPRATCPPGAIRLRALARDLFLPADAELIPPLLGDEAAGLVRQRGLVFLPGPRVLAYTPEAPLPLAALVRVEPLERSAWRRFPPRPRLAEEVEEIALEEPPMAPDELLRPGGEGIGTDSPEPAKGNLPARLTGRTLMGLGRGLAWLGQKLNLPGLAGAGARLLNSALSLAPALSEQLMGKQEAMLRALLRDFRAGRIEEALRRALPLGGDPGRGAMPAQDARLPAHRLFYSLLDLLNTPGGNRPASVWFTAANTYQELLREYRKQADQAARRGDYRRAAFIHARLLNDYRSAAMVLASGGLHRDAAILYLKKLNDPRAAAREWEAAGEIDRAVHLYRELGEHALAGDALRRAGEEERAIEEYQLAAARFPDEQAYEAGELLRTRARRADLALAYYRKGWERRPRGSSIPCALRLAQHHGERSETAPLLRLVDEADEFLEHQDAEPAGTFYNELARLADTPELATARADLRDRALVGLARKLREASPVSRHTWGVLFPAGPWPAPLLRDAEYAVKEARKPAARPAWRTLAAGSSHVTAVCQVPATGEVFLGFEDGELVCYRPQLGDVRTIARDNGAVLSLAADETGATLAVLRQTGLDQMRLALLGRSAGFQMLNHYYLNTADRVWLCPPEQLGLGNHLVVGIGREYRLYRFPSLVCIGSFSSTQFEGIPVACVFCVPPRGENADEMILSFFEEGQVEIWFNDRFTSDPVVGDYSWDSPVLLRFSWTPGLTRESSLRQPLLHLAREDGLQITGLDARGNLHRTRIALATRSVETTSFYPLGPSPYRAFAVLHAGRLAAIHEQGVDWCTAAGQRPRQTHLPLPNPVAAFPQGGGSELLVISADGTLTMLPGTI